jgi:uncharacterized membrane protein
VVKAAESEHLARRIESFSDLVFGFSLSFLSARLVVPKSPDDLFNSFSLAGFAGTFAVIVSLWFFNHRTLRDYFSPHPLDIALVFAGLAGVALMPYALEVALRFDFLAPQPVMLYDFVFMTIVASRGIVCFRGFRRRWREWDEKTRRIKWRVVPRSVAVFALMALSAALAPVNVHAAIACYIVIGIVPRLAAQFAGLPAFARGPAQSTATA